MAKLNNLIGRRFGKLVVVSRLPSRNGKAYWKCQCDCGNMNEVCGNDLIAGKTKSCGCLRREVTRLQGKSRIKHGMAHSRLWNIWSSMKHRCNYKKACNYSDYGGRGITVCPEWSNDFQAFYDWRWLTAIRTV